MSAGFRSDLAPWIGGASSTPNLSTAGFKSFVAIWMGGAQSIAGPPVTSGHVPLSGFICNSGRMMFRGTR